MKKLNLKALKFNAKEVLTRDQLKNVLGGNGSDDPRDECGNRICMDGLGCPDFCGCGSGQVSLPGGNDPSVTYCYSVIV